MSPKKEKDSQEHPPAADSAVRAYTRSKNFVEEIMRENERLRYKVFHLQQELAGLPAAANGRQQDVVSENQKLRRQLDEIKSQFEALNRESEDFRQRYQEVEHQNENLLNLYVSGYQLHSTIDEQAVITVIREILLNLVGAEVFGIWLLDPGSGRMQLVSVTDECGLLEGRPARLPGERLEALRRGEPWSDATGSGVGRGAPLSCVPLKLEERTVGVLAIYKLLEQKEGFTSLDHEILGLLAAQAAATLIGARAFSRGGGSLDWDPGDDGLGVA
ncbi:MAG: GAF domain-containing protein [Candidatus Methylomirabilia bacterium]